MGGFFSMLFSPPSKYDVRQIKVGDSKDRVRALFGEPEESRMDNGFENEWVYTVPFRIYVAIHFDREGNVTRTYRSGERA